MERKIITQIGSLPYEDVGQAVEYSMRHQIPFLPELPKRGEYMLDYIKQPGRLSCLEEFRKRARQQGCQTVKIQCVGPSTLMSNGYGQEDAVRRIQDHVTAILDGLTAQEIALFLDEPTLSFTQPTYQALESVHNALGNPKHNLIFGIHTCNDVDMNKLFALDQIQVISFDASRYGNGFAESYVNRNNKRIAWGINGKGDVKDFQQNDLLTLPCGMSPASYRAEDCERNLEMLLRVSKEV